MPAFTAWGIAVGSAPCMLTETAADQAIAPLAGGARIRKGADYVRAPKWHTWGPTLLVVVT